VKTLKASDYAKIDFEVVLVDDTPSILSHMEWLLDKRNIK